MRVWAALKAVWEASSSAGGPARVLHYRQSPPPAARGARAMGRWGVGERGGGDVNAALMGLNGAPSRARTRAGPQNT